jgi:hypothetical protein
MVGDPLLGESGSTPMNRSVITAFLSGVCTSLHIRTNKLARAAKSRPDLDPPTAEASTLGEQTVIS